MKILIDGKELKYFNTELTLNVSLEDTLKLGLTSLQIFKEDKEFVENLIRSDYFKHYEFSVLGKNNLNIIQGYVSYLNNGNSFNCDYIDLEIYLKNSLEYLEQFYERKITDLLDEDDYYWTLHKLSNVPDEGRLIVFITLIYLLLGSIKYYINEIQSTFSLIAANPQNAGHTLYLIYLFSIIAIDIVAILKYLEEIWKVTLGQRYFAKCVDVRKTLIKIFSKLNINYVDNFQFLNNLFLVLPKDNFGNLVNQPTLKDIIQCVEDVTNTKLVIYKTNNGYDARFIALNSLFPFTTNNVISKFNYENRKPSKYNYHIKQIKYKYDESDLNSLNIDIATDFTVSYVDNTLNTLVQRDIQRVHFKELPFNVAKRKGNLTFFEELLLKLFQAINGLLTLLENTINTVVSAVNAIIDTFNKLIKLINKLLKLGLKEIQKIDKISIKKIDLKSLKETPNFFLTESTAFSVPKLFYGRYAFKHKNRDVYLLQEGSEDLLDMKTLFEYYHKYQTIYEEYDFKTIFCIENGLPDAIQFKGNSNLILEYEWKSKNKLLTGKAINAIDYRQYKKVKFNK